MAFLILPVAAASEIVLIFSLDASRNPLRMEPWRYRRSLGRAMSICAMVSGSKKVGGWVIC